MKNKLFKFLVYLTILSSLSFDNPSPKKHAYLRAIKMENYSDTLKCANGYYATATLFETPKYETITPYKGIKNGNLYLKSCE